MNRRIFFRFFFSSKIMSAIQTGHTDRKNSRGASYHSQMGAPISVIFSMVELRSKTLLRTILKIFCTLIAYDAEQKMSGA